MTDLDTLRQALQAPAEAGAPPDVAALIGGAGACAGSGGDGGRRGGVRRRRGVRRCDGNHAPHQAGDRASRAPGRAGPPHARPVPRPRPRPAAAQPRAGALGHAHTLTIAKPARRHPVPRDPPRPSARCCPRRHRRRQPASNPTAAPDPAPPSSQPSGAAPPPHPPRPDRVATQPLGRRPSESSRIVDTPATFSPRLQPQIGKQNGRQNLRYGLRSLSGLPRSRTTTHRQWRRPAPGTCTTGVQHADRSAGRGRAS